MRREIISGVKLPESVKIPASKSHTIRALLIAAMAKGTSRIVNPLVSDDTLSCLEAVRMLGADVRENSGKWIARGTDIFRDIRNTDAEGGITINTGNSGTTLYLAAGLAALMDIPVTFTGDDQIKSRPVGALLESLQDLGASVTYSGREGYPPFVIRGPLTGGRTVIECPTSQYLSSLLICSPLINGDTEIEVPLLREQPYVEMTLRWLDEQGIKYENRDYKNFVIPGNQKYNAFEKQVPGDFSSATFFACAAAVTGSTITLEGLDMNDSQGDKEVLRMLEKMGCPVSIGELSVTVAGGNLKGGVFDLNDTPDALPALAVTACFADGETRLVNVPQARLKETDRISVMAQELSKLGADIRELPDGLVIRGKDRMDLGPPLKGAEVCGHGDHRVIMSLAVAALAAGGKTVIDDDSAVAITFPGFFNLLGV